jgi:hypothetical protein
VCTFAYTVFMAILSIRFKRKATLDRLKHRTARSGESASGLAERLIEEGLRMDAHPGIVFRDGPSGRRAAIAAGPDVWEVAALLRGLEGPFEERLTTAADRLGLPVSRLRVASRYYAEYTEEIDAEIEANEDAADRELEAWEAERRLLGS